MPPVGPSGPARLVVGLLWSVPGDLALARARLAARHGAPAIEGGPWPFEATDYYAAEMGSGLQRSFFAFAGEFARERLVEEKRAALELEAEAAARPLNVDPGYLTRASLVLASTKDRAHRVYLGSGVFGEVTLLYERGAFRPLPWTYPDFRSERYLAFLAEVRAALLA
jgi:hypothetical protein